MRPAVEFVHVLPVPTIILILAPLGRVPPAARQEAKPPAATVPEEPGPLAIPEGESQRKNPIKADTQSLVVGRKLFSSQCAMCHGPKGDGKGELALELRIPSADFTDLEQQKKRTDGDYFYILSQGHGAMPAQGDRLRSNQMWNLINYIRTLGPAKKAVASQFPITAAADQKISIF